ncbi:hypothetical protein ACHAWF_005416 [Thalassiosira exigua]
MKQDNNTMMITYAFAALGLGLSPAAGFVARTSPVGPSTLPMVAKQPESEPLSTRSRYMMDINALDQLLNAQEEEKLEEIRALVKDIQETRRNNPEVALPHKVREALADFHRAEAKYGHDSREAQISHEYFLDILHADPEHYYDKDEETTSLLQEALGAVNVLEDLKEIAHVEKSILDRFGTTDFEVGEGFLERGIGKEDPDTYGLWP